MSIWAWMLIIHVYHVYSSTNAHLPPPAYPSKPKCSSASNISIQVFDTHLPSPLSPFKPKCSLSASTMSIQASTLVSHLCCHHLSLNTHHLPPPCLFEHKCLSSTSTVPIWARTLIICLHHLFKCKCLSSTSTWTMSSWALYSVYLVLL